MVFRMRTIGFLLIEGYALISTAAALEPLRAANLFSETPPYQIKLLSLNGGDSAASLGSRFSTTAIADAGIEFDLVFVVAGGDPFRLNEPKLISWLRRLDRAGVALGGISGGAVVLACAGLMTNRRFTVHWHHLDQLKAQSSGYFVEQRLFVIDRDRYTCAGGSAPLDMMHAVISAEHGVRFAQRISDWFIQTEIRVSDAPQQASVAARYGIQKRAVLEALELMENHIADPIDLGQLARLTGVSERQLQRQFHDSLGQSVMQVYRRIRLETARTMVRSSGLGIAEISEMTGFTTQAHFSDTYRKVLGVSPSQDRRVSWNGKTAH